MTVKKKGLNAFYFATVAASSLLLSACNDSGGDEASLPPVTYTGVTAQAVINETTAPALADTAISSASLDTSGVTAFVGVSAAGSDTSAVERLKGIADMAKSLSTTPSSSAVDTLAGAQVSGSQPIQGCEGTATISVSYDDEYYYYDPEDYDYPLKNILYSASMTFNNFVDEYYDYYLGGYYCSSEVFNGSISVTEVSYDGPIDQLPQMNGMTLTLNNFYISEGGLSQGFNGSMISSVDTATGVSALTMTMDFKSTDGQVYRAEDYRVGSDGYDNVTSISGRLYDPAYGYIQLTTPTTFSYGSGCTSDNGNPVPDTGVLRIEGANGGYVEIDAAGSGCDNYMLTWSDGVVTTDPIFVNW